MSSTITLQPDGTTGIDTWIDGIDANVNFNYGVATSIRSGQTNKGGKGLLKFDLSMIPADAVGLVATLTLHMASEYDSAQDPTLEIHRSLVEWYEGIRSGSIPSGEDGSVWNYRNHNGSIAWNGGVGGASGSDYSATITDSQVVDAVDYFNFDVTADVQDWIDGTATNYGWWLITTPVVTFNQKVYNSSDSATSGDRPKLVITFSTALASSVAGSSSISGTLVGIGNLIGSAAGNTIIAATLITNEYMQGDSQGSASEIATILGVGYLLGNISGSSSLSGDIQGEILLDPGSAQGIATVAGDIKGVYQMLGESLGSSTASAEPSFEGQLRGSANGSAIATATGYAKALHVTQLEGCYNSPLFYITNGAYKDNGQQDLLDFLSDKAGYRLKNWEPAIIQFKEGGRWANSPTAQGRRLKSYVFDNAVEVLELDLVGPDQNRTIQFLHDLWRFQQAVADYWSSAWSALPIYLVSRTAKETNTHYAIIHMVSCPQLKNIYAQPFFDDKQSALDSIIVRIERGHWLSTPPGEFECVEISSIRSWTVAGWQSGS